MTSAFKSPFLSPSPDRDIGLETVIVSYLESGAPAPEAAAEAPTAEPLEPVEVAGLDPA
jgi:hypothetical protein